MSWRTRHLKFVTYLRQKRSKTCYGATLNGSGYGKEEPDGIAENTLQDRPHILDRPAVVVASGVFLSRALVRLRLPLSSVLPGAFRSRDNIYAMTTKMTNIKLTSKVLHKTRIYSYASFMHDYQPVYLSLVSLVYVQHTWQFVREASHQCRHRHSRQA